MPRLQQIDDNTGRDWFCVLSDDGTALTGPMREADARAFLGLLEAAEPLARMTEVVADHVTDDWQLWVPDHPTKRIRITVGDARRARTAYQAAMRESGR